MLQIVGPLKAKGSTTNHYLIGDPGRRVKSVSQAEHSRFEGAREKVSIEFRELLGRLDSKGGPAQQWH